MKRNKMTLTSPPSPRPIPSPQFHYELSKVEAGSRIFTVDLDESQAKAVVACVIRGLNIDGDNVFRLFENLTHLINTTN